MELSEVRNVFRQWVDALGEQGITARHASRFDVKADEPTMVALLATARVDPERRTRLNGRQRSKERPLARLRYVVAIDGAAEQDRAEEILVHLLIQADSRPEMQVLPEPVTASWWLAHGLAPRPAFQIEVSVTEAVRPPQPALVQELALDMRSLVNIEGRVIWSGGRPLSGAGIRLEPAGQWVFADRRGYFRMSLAGANLEGETVRVRAGEREQVFAVADIAMENGQWLVPMQEPEV